MIDVSIVIVNWNTQDLLVDCIKSLKKETRLCKIEIIVVDNASSDESVKKVKKLFPEVIIIENKNNLGFAKANNMGINKCKGKYVILSNTDIVALDNVVDRMFLYMEKNEGIGAMLPMCVNKEKEIDLCCKRFPSLRLQVNEALYFDKLISKVKFFQGRALPKSFYNSTCDVDSVPCCFIMASRTAIDDVGLLDERFFIYSEDIDWCKRFHQKGWRVIYFSDAKIIHYGGSSSKIAQAKFLIEKHKSELQYWEKHHGSFNKSLFRSILILHYLIRIIGYCILYYVKPHKRKLYPEIINNYYKCALFLIFNRELNIKK